MYYIEVESGKELLVLNFNVDLIIYVKYYYLLS